MRHFRFCDGCGAPWGSHVRRCPGCGRSRAAMGPALLFLALILATLLQARCERELPVTPGRREPIAHAR
jgi:hypothetical protein